MPMPDPVNLCLDQEAVNALFRSSSFHVAVAKRIAVQRENVSNAVIDGYLLGAAASMGPLMPLGLVGAYFARKAFTDTARLDLTIDDALKADAAMVHQRYCNMFENYASRGLGYRYIEEVRSDGQRAWQQWKDKFAQADRTNDSVIHALTAAYDWTSRVKVAADVGMVVVGAVVPLGFVANTGVSLGYSFACKFANTISEAGSSDLQSYSVRDGANDASGAGGNAAQSLADRAVEDARSVQAKRLWMKLEAAAEKQGRRLADALKDVKEGFRAGKLGSPTQQAAARAGFGNPMTSVQVDAARGLAARLEQSAVNATAAAAAARQAARPPASVNAFESYRNASTVGGKAGVVASRGAAILVGLYFLKDSAYEAFVEGQTVADQRKFREAHGLQPR
jgi:hypothetical protein